jgi:Tol biopolymer transport system component
VGGEDETATPDDVQADETPASPSGTDGDLANSSVITTISGSGGAPVGPLWLNDPQSLMVLSADLSGRDLQVVTTADGQIVIDLGIADNPVWSPQGIVLLYQDLNGGRPQAAIYESDTQQTTTISTDSGEDYAQDIPAGWSGTSAYYLRVIGDDRNSVVLYGYEVNSGETTEVWKADNIELAGPRPVMTDNGILIPTVSDWQLVGFDGTATTVDGNASGITGTAILSPYGTLIAYPAGGQIVVASVDTPGTPLGAPIPYASGPGAGFSWEPNGEDLVVSDGATLQIYTNDGNSLGQVTSTDGMAIAAPQWRGDGIYYVEISPEIAYRLLNTGDIPGYNP